MTPSKDKLSPHYDITNETLTLVMSNVPGMDISDKLKDEFEDLSQ